jgi:galactitol-specific phosphotransferase system IIC component
MRNSIAQFIISTVITIGIAFVGVSAICSIVAYSSSAGACRPLAENVATALTIHWLQSERREMAA